MNLLLLVLCLVIVKVSSEEASDENQSPLHICQPHTIKTENRQSPPIANTNNGPVMTAPVAYLIFYGNWAEGDRRNVLNFVKGLGATPWWSLNVQYGAGILTFGGYTTDVGYSQGKSLSNAQIFSVVTNALNKNLLPKDDNGIYMVLTSSDVTMPDFCTKFCGWHYYDGATLYKYSFVGTPPPGCACYNNEMSPNGNMYVDAMMSVIAHELAETVTDPFLNAWKDSDGEENADKCVWNYFSTRNAANGARYNVHVGLNKYLIQSNWKLRTQQCALSDDSFPLLSANQRISSPNKFYYLTLQADNNLVIYRYSDGVAIWSSSTQNKGTTKAIFQTDGNFVLYTDNWQPKWNSGTNGNPGSYLNLQDDGNLVIYTSEDKSIWQSNSQTSTSNSWLTLGTNQKLDSPTKLFYLLMRSDQNLVIYRYSNNEPIWDSNTLNSGATKAVHQYDGNFVLYTSSNKAVWSSGTDKHPGSRLEMQDDGNLVIYTLEGTPIWASNSAAGVESTSSGTFTVSCGNEFVSYCGTRNSQFKNQEKFRYSIPTDSRTCQCYDYFGVTCRAYCSPKAIQGFEIVSKSFKGESTVSCPAGKQVIGCNTVPSNTNLEVWPHFYPTSDGTQCNCYNYYGATCVATCASGLTGYEVVKSSGTGFSKAICPAGKYVRGCGLNTFGPGVEQFRTVSVDDVTSCSCYDYYGADCYAVCTA